MQHASRVSVKCKLSNFRVVNCKFSNLQVVSYNSTCLYVATCDPRGVLEPSRTSKIEIFAEVVNDFQPLTIFAKSSILDV